MGKSLCCIKWEETYSWLSQVNEVKHMAYCKLCLNFFRIDNRGLSQVKSYDKCQKPGLGISNQRTFEVGQKDDVTLWKNSFVLSPEDAKIVNKNL